MSFISKHARLVVVAVCCLALGAGASVIASAGAATQTAKTTHHRHARRGGIAQLRRLTRRTVHADLVVATKTGFVTVTVNRGKVDSVNGQQLTMTDGTKKQSYQTVTLTIPSTAKVRDNGHTASLSSLSSGQRVIVVQAPDHTWVVARTPKSS